jgi:hypothetical protein
MSHDRQNSSHLNETTHDIHLSPNYNKHSPPIQSASGHNTMTSRVESSPPCRPAKPTRVLACVLCQQRKVKCDRKFPCMNCVKAKTQCVPSTQLTRRRRRRIPEQELLDRLRRYEGLLGKNNIQFEPIDECGEDWSYRNTSCESPESAFDVSSRKLAAGHGEQLRGQENRVNEAVYETKYDFLFRLLKSSLTMVQKLLGRYESKGKVSPRIHLASISNAKQPKNVKDSNNASELEFEDHASFEQMPESVVTKAWEHMRESDDLLLFGPRRIDHALSALHPPHAHIFKLWQIYLDNVNPLLKVTHTPTLQARIIDIVGNLDNIETALEALMFSIYCIAIMSLDDHECVGVFGSSKKELLKAYQFACQQALLRCNFLRSSNRDCLTALLLYVVGLPIPIRITNLIMTRSQFDPTHILNHCLPSLLSLFALHSACPFPASRPTPNTMFSRPRCVGGCGGLSF